VNLRAQIRLRLSALLGPLVVTLALPVVATANSTLVVENPSGVRQAATQIHYQEESTWLSYPATSVYGQTTASFAAGQLLYVTRDDTSTCPAPEGAGQLFTVPSPVPAQMTVTLPSSSGPPTEPGLSASERGFVGLVNQARAQAGATPLEISRTASAAADGYSSTAPVNHCGLGSPLSRLIDAGYPVSPTNRNQQEVIATMAASAHSAFNELMASLPHRTTLLDPTLHVIGVGRVGGAWTANLLPACSEGCERAQLTGDFGDPALADEDPSDGQPSDQPSGPGSRCAGLSGAKLKRCLAKAIKKCKRKHGKKRKRCIKRIRQKAGGNSS
jgi:uncharacterized protein YkwD